MYEKESSLSVCERKYLNETQHLTRVIVRLDSTVDFVLEVEI